MSTKRIGPGDTVRKMFEGGIILRNIGVDTEGRSHHYKPETHTIIVCSEDRRGQGVRDEHIEMRLTPPEWSTGTWDYIDFVREQVDGLDWEQTDAPEEPPEDLK